VPEYILSFKPTLDLYGTHDPSAAMFEDGRLAMPIEEERLTGRKHAVDTFSKFEELTGVPAVLNTSFNGHAERIVTKPIEAVKDFYGTCLDALVLGDALVEK